MSAQAKVLVVSDTCATDQSQDSVGPLLVQAIEQSGFQVSISYVADELTEISQKVSELAKDAKLVLTTGGTGLGQRDVTPEAVTPILEKLAPGMVAAMLNYGLNVTELAALGRPVAGMIGGTVVLCVPGSRGGALDSWNAVKGVVTHALDVWSKGRDAHAHSHGPGHGHSHGKPHAHGHVHSESHSHAGPHSRGPSHHSESHSCSHSHGGPHSHGKSHAAHHGPIFYTTASRPRSSPYPMIPFSKAQSIVLDAAQKPINISIPLKDAVGYIIAQDLHSRLNVPSFRASIVDGYAVLHSECPNTFPVKNVSLASSDISWFEPGSCTRITTGAPVPHGATAVVPVEDTELMEEKDGEEVTVKINAENVNNGDNIREIGSDITLGSTVLHAGTRISMLGGEVGTISAIGLDKVNVWKRLTVGVLSTGDEVVDPGKQCSSDSTIWDVNRPMLLSALNAHGYPNLDLGIASDKRDTLTKAIKDALEKCDVLITSGGVSMGELDLLKPIIKEIGGTIHFGRVEMKPGKPVTFATIGEKAIFALPGNPASAAVCFHLFVQPYLVKSSGGDPNRTKLKAALDFDARLDPRPEFQRVHVRATPSGWVASSTGFQRSSRVTSMAYANALVQLPSGTGVLNKGTLVDVILLDQV